MKKGIDVSSWQNTIDWDKVKASGQVDFAILRACYGCTKDKTFETNYTRAKKAGIPLGVYCYSYAKSVEGAKREAQTLLVWLKGKKLDLPVYYDIEDSSQKGLSKEVRTKMCEVFCDTIKAAGYVSGIYSNKNWADNFIDGAALGKKYPYWIAQYYTKCTYTGKYDIWQYSSSGKINGINGNVDLNYMVNDILSGNVTQSSAAKTESETTKKIHVVIKGETLTSIAKKYGTTVDKLVKVNNIKNRNLIYVGQKIEIQ